MEGGEGTEPGSNRAGGKEDFLARAPGGKAIEEEKGNPSFRSD